MSFNYSTSVLLIFILWYTCSLLFLPVTGTSRLREFNVTWFFLWLFFFLLKYLSTTSVPLVIVLNGGVVNAYWYALYLFPGTTLQSVVTLYYWIMFLHALFFYVLALGAALSVVASTTVGFYIKLTYHWIYAQPVASLSL